MACLIRTEITSDFFFLNHVHSFFNFKILLFIPFYFFFFFLSFGHLVDIMMFS